MHNRKDRIEDLELKLERINNNEADYQDYYRDWQELSQEIQQLQTKINATQHIIDTNKPKVIYNPRNVAEFEINKKLYSKIDPAEVNIKHYKVSLATLQRQLNELNNVMQQLYQQIQKQQPDKQFIITELHELRSIPNLKIKINK